MDTRAEVVWDFRCYAKCDNRLALATSLNEIEWFAHEHGWLLDLDPEGWSVNILCPDHVGEGFYPGQKWLVECADCDWEEEFSTEDEAKDEAGDHNSHDCDYGCSHYARVLSPDDQQQRELRRRAARVDNQRRAQEKAYQEVYVEYLVVEDQKRRRDLEQGRFQAPRGKRPTQASVGSTVPRRVRSGVLRTDPRWLRRARVWR